MNSSYAQTELEGKLPLPDVPGMASSLLMPGIQAWQDFLVRNAACALTKP